MGIEECSKEISITVMYINILFFNHILECHGYYTNNYWHWSINRGDKHWLLGGPLDGRQSWLHVGARGRPAPGVSVVGPQQTGLLRHWWRTNVRSTEESEWSVWSGRCPLFAFVQLHLRGYCSIRWRETIYMGIFIRLYHLFPETCTLVI